MLIGLPQSVQGTSLMSLTRWCGATDNDDWWWRAAGSDKQFHTLPQPSLKTAQFLAMSACIFHKCHQEQSKDFAKRLLGESRVQGQSPVRGFEGQSPHEAGDVHIIYYRNTFCGAWYLPHSWINYDRHCHCYAHVRNFLIPTSGLKCNVTVVFLDPDFLYLHLDVWWRLKHNLWYFVDSTYRLTPIVHLTFTLPYLTFGVGGYWPPSAEAITGLAQCASPK